MLLRIHHMRLEFRNVKPGCRRTAPIVESLLESFRFKPRKLGGTESATAWRTASAVERCKSCGFCVEFCPTKVLALSSAFNSKGYHPPHVIHPEKRSGCDLCGMYCPDFAIYGTMVPADSIIGGEALEACDGSHGRA